MNFPTLLVASRSCAGLTLRAAHAMTLAVARMLGSRHYGIALGQLSDYEAANTLPRHIAKILSLSIVYGIDPLDMIAAAGFFVDDSNKVPMPLHESKGVGLRNFPGEGKSACAIAAVQATAGFESDFRCDGREKLVLPFSQ